MARPKMMKNGGAVKLYLPAELVAAGSKLAFARNGSLSGLVRMLLEKEVKKSPKTRALFFGPCR